MSNHNYSQYSNKKQDKPVVEEEVKVEAAIETETVEETVQAPTPTVEVKTEAPKTTTGVIVSCTRLNVREEPESDADVVCVLDKNADVEINMAQSTNEFFRVTTASGVEGFCMRQFVKANL